METLFSAFSLARVVWSISKQSVCGLESAHTHLCITGKMYLFNRSTVDSIDPGLAFGVKQTASKRSLSSVKRSKSAAVDS